MNDRMIANRVADTMSHVRVTAVIGKTARIAMAEMSENNLDARRDLIDPVGEKILHQDQLSVGRREEATEMDRERGDLGKTCRRGSTPGTKMDRRIRPVEGVVVVELRVRVRG